VLSWAAHSYLGQHNRLAGVTATGIDRGLRKLRIKAFAAAAAAAGKEHAGAYHWVPARGLSEVRAQSLQRLRRSARQAVTRVSC
jgi:hypothetical protein